jgi:GT2 family glycosyltransferase
VAADPNLPERAVPGAMVRQDFAVIVPAYNEAENIPELVRELRATWESHGLDGEVVLVDDGSTDDTAERAVAEGGTGSRSSGTAATSERRRRW